MTVITRDVAMALAKEAVREHIWRRARRAFWFSSAHLGVQLGAVAMVVAIWVSRGMPDRSLWQHLVADAVAFLIGFTAWDVKIRYRRMTLAKILHEVAAHNRAIEEERASGGDN